MSDTDHVSVIVAVLNAANYLATALDSVVRQRPSAEEILVIDGGSTDGSEEIAASRPGVRVIRQTGHGLAAARNQAILASRCPLIAFCDADDRWSEDALAVRLRVLEGVRRRSPSSAASFWRNSKAPPPQRRSKRGSVGLSPASRLAPC